MYLESDKFLEEPQDELKLDEKRRVQMWVSTDCDDAKVYNFCSTQLNVNYTSQYV
jgi:hypothetical protein